MAVVPLYDTLGLEAMVHILNLGKKTPMQLNTFKGTVHHKPWLCMMCLPVSHNDDECTVSILLQYCFVDY